MAKPFQIFADGKELEQYTGAKLSRKKADLTGSFDCDVFFNYMPKSPIMVQALRGRDISVYVGGQLAFFGAIDKRNGKGHSNKDAVSEVTSSISPNAYSVSLSARGRTKYLIDSSHQHKTGTMLKPTTRQVAEALTKDFQVELDWQAADVKLERVCLRDGCNVLYELQRLGNENGHYFYETRDGKLRFTDEPQEMGDDLILGTNILSFSADQSEDHDKSRIVVKGQRISKTVWGEEAVLNVLKSAKKASTDKDTPFIIQHYGDASPEALDRRLKFESDKRTAQSLKVTIDVFHVQTPSGQPWDLGTLHYVEVPPEGIFNVMEVIELDYTVDAQGTLKTTLTLAPPPAPSSGVPTTTKAGIGKQRRAQLGVETMDIWEPADLQFSPSFSQAPVIQQPDFLGGIQINTPPLKLP
jgi:prophage tail gpP-like protein